ncbi:MAG TPA: BLUF domain-containing protein, partial [Chitinophagaceae bacterium]
MAGDFLRYYGGGFIQVIEGPVADVSMLVESIRPDTRHEQIIMLCDEPVTKRDFPAWSMGFELLPEE